jgi:hypothetical protein
MTVAHQREARGRLVAQAALVWGGDSTDIPKFIETGEFSDSRAEVMPYNPAVLEEAAKNWKWASHSADASEKVTEHGITK